MLTWLGRRPDSDLRSGGFGRHRDDLFRRTPGRALGSELRETETGPLDVKFEILLFNSNLIGYAGTGNPISSRGPDRSIYSSVVNPGFSRLGFSRSSLIRRLR